MGPCFSEVIDDQMVNQTYISGVKDKLHPGYIGRATIHNSFFLQYTNKKFRDSIPC